MAEVRKRIGGVLLFILLSTSAAWTQAITGTILGTITDESGAVLPGVTVTAINADTGLARTVATGESGNYSISNLRIGSYQLESELVGFKKAVRSGITLDIDSRIRIDFAMAVGQRTDVVDVSTTRLLLQADDSSVGTVIDRRKILDLPLNGRQFELLVQLVPGAVTPAQGSHLSSRGGFNIGGMDEHYNSFFLDGIDNVDPIIRNFSFRPSIDLIQEFKVQETGYNAEFGRNAGAVVNVTTRSGTNVFHGSAWEFLRNDHLDARNYFAPIGTPKASLIRNQFGATLGGPVVQGKTFFFLAYEGGRQKAGSTRRASVPTPLMRTGDLSETGSVIRDPQQSGDTPFIGSIIPQDRIHPIARAVMDAYPLPNLPNAGVRNNRSETGNRIEDTNDISVKLDHQLMPGTSMTGRYSYSVARILDVFRTESGGGTNLANFGQVADRIRTNAGLSIATVSGKSFVNEVRIGYNRFKQPQIPINDGPAILQPLQGLVKTFLPFSVTGSDLIGNPGLADRVVNVYNYIDNVSYTARSHQLKAGVDVRRYLFNAFAASSNFFTFDGSRSGSAFSDFLLGLPSLTKSVVGSPTGNPRKVEAALYIQDDWKVSRRLTLNYGLRWEFYGRMNEKVNKQSTWVENCNCMKQAGDGISEKLTDNDLNNFAPRFGFAFMPFSESATVIRGGAGIFYDNDQRTNFQFVANPPFLVTQEFRASQIPTLSMDNPFPSNTGVVTLSPSAVPPHYVDTYAETWNLGVQHELSGGTLLDVSYVGNHTLKATRIRNINQPVNGVRPYAGFAAITMFEQAGSSNFHSMQARGERRFAQGFSFISSYTWGHAIDDRPGQGGGRAQNNYNMRAERADSDFDVRHRWTFSVLYDLPFGAGRRFGAGWTGPINALLGGWGIDGISTMQGGRPFTVSLGQDTSGAGNGADRPNLVSGVDLVPEKQGPDNWINKSAFTPLAPQTFGTAGRNIGRGPRLHTLDISLGKHQRVGDNLNVQFRAEFFNALNHPNFALPATAFDSPVFGTISSTSTSERQIQFGLRLDY